MNELLRQIIAFAQTLSPEEREILSQAIELDRKLPVIEV